MSIFVCQAFAMALQRYRYSWHSSMGYAAARACRQAQRLVPASQNAGIRSAPAPSWTRAHRIFCYRPLLDRVAIRNHPMGANR